MSRVTLSPHGLCIGEVEVPLLSGALHYFRTPRRYWGAALDSMKAMGFTFVDTYVPWGVHERSKGEFDFEDPDLDVRAFLDMAKERGLWVILRPGPHINAELTYFGLPERVVWNPECQAKTPKGHPVLLPMLPTAFPVPSYASEVFFDETRVWFSALGKVLSGCMAPEGPVALLQVDNEGALYFRDGPYDQDYHPDAVLLFREFLREKYATVSDLRAAWSSPDVTFALASPPVAFDAESADALPRHMDWVLFHEELIARGMRRMKAMLSEAGLCGVPTSHNFPLGEAGTALNAARLGEVVDLIGYDYYHKATPREHLTLFRRTTELVSRSEGMGTPAFGAEVGAGFPPFFPPMDEQDNLYALTAALAYGLRAFNLYMAVSRDRWIGAPIDPHGQRLPLSERYELLLRALVRTAFHTLRRRTPVRLVVPRSMRRLARVMHAFGPATPALFQVLGAGFGESCFEEPLGFEDAPPLLGEAYLRSFERALFARGVPFAYATGEALDRSTSSASWIVVATVGGIKRDFFQTLSGVASRGARVTIGPTIPTRDGSMRTLEIPHDAQGLEVVPLLHRADADALVAKRIEELGLPTYPADPMDAFVCVHENSLGEPKVVFVHNPTAEDRTVKFVLGSVRTLRDALTFALVTRTKGGFECVVHARNFRMFEVE